MRRYVIASASLTGLMLASVLVANAAVRQPPDEPERVEPDAEPEEKKDRCYNGLSCLGLNIICYGEFRCKDERWWGCARGECIPHKDRDY